MNHLKIVAETTKEVIAVNGDTYLHTKTCDLIEDGELKYYFPVGSADVEVSAGIVNIVFHDETVLSLGTQIRCSNGKIYNKVTL